MTIEVLNVSKNYGGKPYLKSASLNISSGSVNICRRREKER